MNTHFYLGTLLSAFVVLSSTGHAAAQSVSVMPCPNQETDEVEQLRETVACLENRQRQLAELLEALLRVQDELARDLDTETTRIDAKIDGPEKIVEHFEAVQMAWTEGYGVTANNPERFRCKSELADRPGFTIVGGELGDPVRLRRQQGSPLGGAIVYRPGNTEIYGRTGCAPSHFCRGGAQYCDIIPRSAGCYINNEWHDWYVLTRSRRGLPILMEHICEG